MHVGTALLLLGLVMLAIYARLFTRTVRSADPEELLRYHSIFARKKLNMVGALLIFGAFLVPVVWVATSLGVATLGWIALGTINQRRKMRELGFERSFTERLYRVSFVSPLAIGCLLASKVWFQLHAT